MATAREIIQTAYRKAGVVPLLQAPTAAMAAIALTELNRLIANYVGFGSSLPWDTVRADRTVELYPEDPSLRLALQNTSAITLTLPRLPRDGSRLQIIDPNLTLAAAPVTLARNGWQIEGAATNLVLNTNGANRMWMFRADTGNWARAANLALDDALPFPDDFDLGMALLLAQRLGGEFRVQLSPQDQGFAKDAHTRLRSRYVKPPRQFSPTDIQLAGGAIYEWPWGSYLEARDPYG